MPTPMPMPIHPLSRLQFFPPSTKVPPPSDAPKRQDYHSHIQPAPHLHRLVYQHLHLLPDRDVRFYEHGGLLAISLADQFVRRGRGRVDSKGAARVGPQVGADDEPRALGGEGEGDGAAEAGGGAGYYGDFVVEASGRGCRWGHCSSGE